MPVPSAPPLPRGPEEPVNVAGTHPSRGDCREGDRLLFCQSSSYEYDPRCLPGCEVIFVSEDATQGGEQPCRVTFPTGITCNVAYTDLFVLGASHQAAATWDSVQCGAGLRVEGAKVVKISSAPYESAVALGSLAAFSGSERVQWRVLLGPASERSMLGFAKEGTSVKGTGVTLTKPDIFAVDTSDGSLYSKSRGQVGKPCLHRPLPPGTVLEFTADPGTGTIALSVDRGDPEPLWKGVHDALPLLPYAELCMEGATLTIV
eukprot:TRINITY_DN51586_c0_g1_i1.p2 TRINITY_DN51586_c0_g1~~TRINITY_DN51586_c0_g1_i1.p2  ORF type:complete len:284 (+),score=57.73 TRINITY_DN51586_c0_g1_i1:72-854(+)